MSPYLSLPRARIVHLKGWGQIADPSADHFRVELADVGELAVYRPGLLREKKIISMSIAHLSLTANTQQATTGGGYVGGGFGVLGAALGIYQARILNSLSKRTREYTLLGAYTTLPNGAHRDAVFAFQNLDESQVRDKLAAAIAAWSDGYVTATLNTYREQPIHDSDLQATYAEIDQMHERGMLGRAAAILPART